MRLDIERILVPLEFSAEFKYEIVPLEILVYGA